MSDLEFALYQSFALSTQPVLTRMNEGVGRTADADLYAAHADGAMLQNAVRRLPELQRDLLQAKYGMVPEALAALADYVSAVHGLHPDLAKVVVLHWLDYKRKPELKSVVPLFTASYSTLVRKTRAICIELDVLNRRSLANLLLRLRA